MNTIIQMAIAKALNVLWIRIKKGVASALLKLILPGFCASQRGDAEQTKQLSQSIEVTVKVGDDVVTVKVGGEEEGGNSPESESLARQCRLPLKKERLLKLLRDAADSQ